MPTLGSSQRIVFFIRMDVGTYLRTYATRVCGGNNWTPSFPLSVFLTRSLFLPLTAVLSCSLSLSLSLSLSRCSSLSRALKLNKHRYLHSISGDADVTRQSGYGERAWAAYARLHLSFTYLRTEFFIATSCLALGIRKWRSLAIKSTKQRWD